MWKHQLRKCCYCERQRDLKREPDIEHFRPKGAVWEDRTHPGYWWLAYRWGNLYFACKTCNQEYKETHFPLIGGTRARGPSDSLASEQPALIDPSADNPEELLDYTWEPGPIPLAKPIGRDAEGRGQTTVNTVGLDRTELNTQRGRLLVSLEGLAHQLITALNTPHVNEDCVRLAKKRVLDATKAEKEFAGFRREYFRKLGLGDYVADD